MTPRHNSDKDLYGKLKNGDLESFDAIFDRFYPALCAYGAQFVSLQDAENIVQDVMLWLWENREGMMIENALGTYLFRAVKNRCLTLINRGAIRSKVVSDLQQSMREKFDSPDFYGRRGPRRTPRSRTGGVAADIPAGFRNEPFPGQKLQGDSRHARPLAKNR